MKSWVNYHSHTTYCDGKAPAEDFAREAVRTGIPAYGFSSHAPVPFQSSWNMQPEMVPGYVEEVNMIREKYKSRLQVYIGMEVDFIPGLAGRHGKLLKDTLLDYFIGSIHYLDKFSNGEYWNIDTSFELFEKGLREIFSNNVKKAAIKFWEITRQMVEEDRPDIIGHMDKIKMFNKNNILFSEDEKWYNDQVELTLKTIKKYDTIIEINTRGVYKHGPRYLYPGEKIISRISRMGIPVILSSDAHLPEEITKGLAYAAGILLKHDIRMVTALYNEKWNTYKLTGEGILIE